LTVLSGTCGWSYQEWVGAFYPNNRVAKLRYYSGIFNSVEVDSSFYRAPSKSMVAGWIKATKPDFKFSLKIPKTITHDKCLGGAEEDFLDFMNLMEPMARVDKLGCLLAQLPPDFTFKERANLESFFNLLPNDIHFAVEFSHESWNRKETWDLLKKYHVANTVTDSPIEFLTKPVVTATTHSYVRWHGRGKSIWYDYTYSEQEMRPWLDLLRELEEKVPVIYAYFNNHYHASAPINLLQLLDMSGEINDPQKKVKARAERYQRRKAIKKITDF
jgi:uncharacterized protein YecE (DUF72 family)